METVSNLTPFTSYNCTLHAVTVSDGPLSDPVVVKTAEHGIQLAMCMINYATVVFSS